MNLVILGLPGSGKGTQAKIIAQKYGLYHFSAGELAREWSKIDPVIGEIIKSGQLIPEEKMTAKVFEYLSAELKSFDNILFEGYPRFVSQYEHLESWLGNKGSQISFVIYLKLSSEDVIQRLTTRRTCSKCERIYNLLTNPPPAEGRCVCGGELYQRSDDNITAITARFEAYKKNVQPLCDWLETKGKLIIINGAKSIAEVTADIIKAVGL